tara:strand:- start:6847 stop:7011 length:165 start_codon:yes stop_codon:yes gene_type:complete
MMPENSVDALAFYLLIGIISLIVGNLIYQSLFSNWGEISYFEPKCPAPCCEEEE